MADENVQNAQPEEAEEVNTEAVETAEAPAEAPEVEEATQDQKPEDDAPAE